MTSPLKIAVILAAGLGSRLKEHTQNKPKAFLEIDGKSLIIRSIESLLALGMEKIIIGTGYLNSYFDELSKTYPQVVTMRNNEYATTGSMYTLYTVRKLIHESFLLLEGDLLYEPAALDYLVKDEHEDIVLASDATHSGDEVYIQCSKQGFLQTMSKERGSLGHADGELVGISKLSMDALNRMIAFAEENYHKNKKGIHYEDALVGIASGR